MNVSESALVAGISHLEVDNDTAFNAPTTELLFQLVRLAVRLW